MMQFPPGDSVYRILSVDPGTSDLGWAYIELDLATYQMRLIDAQTVHVQNAVKHWPHFADDWGWRQTRLYSLQRMFETLIPTIRPHCFISEAAHMGQFVTTFEALTECLSMMRWVAFRYDPGLILETIDGPTVKKSVGVPGQKPKGTDRDHYKNMVRNALRGMPHLNSAPYIDFDRLEEHAIDAIAVGYYKLRCLLPAIF